MMLRFTALSLLALTAFQVAAKPDPVAPDPNSPRPIAAADTLFIEDIPQLAFQVATLASARPVPPELAIAAALSVLCIGCRGARLLRAFAPGAAARLGATTLSATTPARGTGRTAVEVQPPAGGAADKAPDGLPQPKVDTTRV